ncbi:MAG: hypothetical protein GW775_01345 [Candidatus Magasanikbacteria bacterium]|uniref:Uncharacterized protein n=1 Tax=Candidatus Magasanikbacteria bacterium CG10_big_fil_rev_8_21_14_0_10_38_6 TaxID=1974647 RepID=A0A2M6P147_9BACT|nr:hypothetical protein [Candidatus Magasanikbacteria bacterium]PIR77424.1 MAG: hypothetical protein COU30_02485 [Candidatus Magasanikbacteria bacterium CG10_big_fil_rev_8_21_14_0_10_38_6]
MRYHHRKQVPPRRFYVPRDFINGKWIGRPSVWYGIARRLAYSERITQKDPYLRLHFAHAGRNGDPWGGMSLEVNGETYHFGAGMHRYPHCITKDRDVTEEGLNMLATGMPGYLTVEWIDWRWVQIECDVTPLFQPEDIKKIHVLYQKMAQHPELVPPYQSPTWAKRFGKHILLPDGRNCTTIHMKNMEPYLGCTVQEHSPLLAMNTLQQHLAARGYTRLATSGDNAVSHLLCLPEEQLWGRVLAYDDRVDWNLVAKGEQPLPSGMQLKDLR